MTIFALRRFAPIFALLLFASTRSVRAEVIRSFHSDVRLHADASLDVTETIYMDFESAKRHGIYRIIPIIYDRAGKLYTLKLKVQSVTQDGKTAKSTVTHPGRNLSLRIGNADKLISGAHLYVLRYEVRGAVNFFNGQPEVCWNVNGSDWPFAMQSVTARFYLPRGVAVKKLRADCYVGSPGSAKRGKIVREKNSLFFCAGKLPPGEEMTFVVRAPKGSARETPRKKPASQTL